MVKRDNEFRVDGDIDSSWTLKALKSDRNRLQLSFGGRKKPNNPNVLLNILRPKMVERDFSSSGAISENAVPQ